MAFDQPEKHPDAQIQYMIEANNKILAEIERAFDHMPRPDCTVSRSAMIIGEGVRRFKAVRNYARLMFGD
jgi:hypothetical protein